MTDSFNQSQEKYGKNSEKVSPVINEFTVFSMRINKYNKFWHDKTNLIFQICKKENLKENYTSYKIKRIGILIYIEELKALLNKVSPVLKRERVLILEP